MIKRLFFALLCLGLCSVVSSPCFASKRVALVIGNGDYKTAPLGNPANDVVDMAETLRGLRFDVIERVNAGREEMDRAVEQFYRNLHKADVGLFYYAGHGMQLDGVNYLLPVDIQVKSPADIRHRAVKTDWILGKMEDSGSDVNIVVLDAFRDNPFRGLRGAGPGLAQVQAVRGSYIAYATAPGSVARDDLFIAYSDRTVLDTRTNLMWSAEDNGANLDWRAANKYCYTYRGGGYMDWRMPTQNELAGLLDWNKGHKVTESSLRAHLTEFIPTVSLFGWIL